MKRIVLTGLIVMFVAIAAAVALPFIISSETVRSALLERAREITGREMRFSGDPSVLLNPFLGIEIRDVTFHDSYSDADAKPILSMPTLTARLNWSAALGGQVEIDQFTFVRPVFRLSIRKSGKSNWAFPEGIVWDALQVANRLKDATPTGQEADTAALPNIGLGKFEVQDGIVEYENHQTGRIEAVTNFNGQLVWSNIRSPWSFKGNGIWRGEIINVETTAAKPVMLLAGGMSNITASVTSKPLNLKFDGEMNRLADLYFAGNLMVNSSSLRRMINLLGGKAEPGSSFSDFSATGVVSGTLKQYQLDNASIVLDGNTSTGTIRLSQSEGGITRISGTLASQLIDTSPYFDASILAGDDDEETSLLPILDQSEIDIRLSASKMLVGGAELSDFAGGIMAKNGALVVDIGNAFLAEGLLVGKVGAERDSGTLRLSADLSLGPVNPSNLNFIGSLSAIQPNGSSNISIKLNTSGRDIDSLAQNLDGVLNVRMERGLLAGLDFSNIRTSIEKPAGSAENVTIASTIAQTSVTDFVFDAVINKGVAWVSESRFKVQDYTAKFAGKADLRFSNLAIWGSLEKSNSDAGPSAPHQFFLGGTLSRPLFVPDVYSGLPRTETPLLPVDPAIKSGAEAGQTN